MKALRITSGILLGAAILGGAWVLWYHSDWIKPPPAAEEPEPVTDVPVHVTKITRATLHKYIECFGVAAPAQIYSGGTPASARVTAPAPGIISELRCFIGQHVDKNAVLFQLDDRVARAEESKAEAALGSARAAEASAQASLHKLKASTRPEQVAIAEFALRKARQGVKPAAESQHTSRASCERGECTEKSTPGRGDCSAEPRSQQDAGQGRISSREAGRGIRRSAGGRTRRPGQCREATHALEEPPGAGGTRRSRCKGRRSSRKSCRNREGACRDSAAAYAADCHSATRCHGDKNQRERGRICGCHQPRSEERRVGKESR